MQRVLTIVIATVLLFPITSFGQSRTRRSSTPQRRATTTSKTSDVQRQGAARVADEIKTLTRFLYLLGGVAKGLEGIDDAARRNEASPAIVEQGKRNKETVRSSIQAIRERLDKLEIDFRTTPDLQRYYIKLAGSAAGAASAEELAAANQFDKAGRKLLDVINRLTDVLLEMRG